eukprot:GEMP01037366.1.p1 GENE.GEMP01037366.1~~GEMP01037366.1.p1  ORF type:complete len:431 (+),score=87.16 GEMP01037366.1:303-1595(+)
MAKWEISYFWLHAEELLRCKLTPGCEGDGLPQGIWDAMPCNRELLYQVDATMACAIGMMHLMTACVLKMWAEAQYRQSSLYFDQALGFLVLSLDCEEQHTYEWPISTSMILGNYNRFIAAAFPSGPLRIEHRDGYDAAGPIVRKNAFQWRTHETWLSCPEEPAAKPPQNISVACLVPVMWPAEKESYDVIRETWGAECDAIYFFVAVAEGAELPEDVVNLSSFFPSIIHDAVASKLDGNQRPRASGANQKDLLLFAWAAEYLGAFDWFCRIETDGYFSTENFKRMAPEDHKNQAIFLGATMLWTTHFEPRLIVQEQPQCLSSKALHRLHNVVARASWTESPSYLECELAPGHRGDLVLALCLNDAFVTPKISVDARGRDFFVAYPWESQRHYRPEEHAVRAETLFLRFSYYAISTPKEIATGAHHLTEFL